MSRGIDSDTVAAGIGPLEFDVEMSRELGWTEGQIRACWDHLAAVYRDHSSAIAHAKGYTAMCPVCECWTEPPPAPCHLCERDRQRERERKFDGGRP